MNFRKVEEKDRQQLLQLHHDFHIKYHREQLLATSPIFPIIQYKNPEETIKKSVDEMYDGSHICFLAEDQSQIIAFISGKILDMEDKIFGKEGYIDDWFVKEAYRSQGIGRKIYALLLDEFKKSKCTHLAIGGYFENEKAIKFYRELGFHNFTLTLKKKIDE